ncbi:MAG TPA: hypothetical protein VGR15_08790 [Bacteroidota bacterium]|jgi:hypothetical protein|nr:hypothetical protein [Bacteroidota bacterium]
MMKRIVAVLLGLTSLTSLSCLNPFSPKLDFNLQALLCNDLTNIENVLCTFRNAYAFKDTTLYGAIIASDFFFIYRDYDKGVDVSWGRDEEMRTTYGLFQSVQSLSLIWNSEIPIVESDTLRSIQRVFNLTVTFNPSDVTGVDGNAILTFARPTPNDPWKIVRWRDESNY